jgi:hypothetical protein
MFGFQGGESAGTLARKKGYTQDAQRAMGLYDKFDLSTIKNEVQLSSMVKDAPASRRRRPRATFRPGCKIRSFDA